MGLSNLSFSATNINAGNDADKPPATIGGLYIATDTNMVYVCYVDGVWASTNPQTYDIICGHGITLYENNSTISKSVSTSLVNFVDIEINDIPDNCSITSLLMKVIYSGDVGGNTAFIYLYINDMYYGMQARVITNDSSDYTRYIEIDFSNYDSLEKDKFSLVNGDVLSIEIKNNIGSRIMTIKGVEITGNIIPRYTNLNNPSFTDI